ncbi:MAG: BREX-1 system adenine-specific DNA-methyltransferase PglX [Massilibacteroides sp.]|nr:BREX-1 system adenine-specific DNA-methyltransferase PglX [Massilibacteroides sp.]
MDTNQIKRFAIEARNKLKEGVAMKMASLGFTKKGDVAENMRPTLIQGGSLWKGQIQTETFFHQWMSLYARIQDKGMNVVYEEAAYTWFNRLVAIRILQKNGLAEPILNFADEARTPRIVDEARGGRIPQMTEEERKHLMELLDDDTKTTEQFALLITAWCHQNPIIEKCFGAIADYTELLLPNNILAEGGFLDMLNHTEFITDDDFKSPELIGWLYQFYISERKDEVFAKKGKFSADEIPAATQIFTPNWIVKYMVENSVGRIYLDNNPHATAMKKRWKYLVDPDTPTPEESKYRYNELTELRIADLACGSGHILNECFDILYDLYIAEGYTRSEAIENIFRHNLTGIDLDKRAQQLAIFALLLKACQKDRSYVDAKLLPAVLTMPQPWSEAKNGSLSTALSLFFNGCETPTIVEELQTAFELMKDADSLGSIMKFDISDTTRFALKQAVEYWANERFVPEVVKEMTPNIQLILALTERYAAIVMNPPYMGGGNMNEVLSKYVKKNYEEGKADLATVFVKMMGERTQEKGVYGYIIPPSWMFLSTFEGLRKSLLSNQSIQSLLHLSRGVFGADFGSSAAVIKNYEDQQAKGTYFRLVERTFQEFDQNHLRMLFEQTLANHDFKYYFKDYDKEVTELPYSENGNKIYYSGISQQNFNKIPGSPIGYWVSKRVIDAFINNSKLSHIAKPHSGMGTGNTTYFLRLWFEVCKDKINNSIIRSKKWIKYDKGGDYKRWYGNKEYVVNWENEGEEMKKGSGFRSASFASYDKDHISWSNMFSGNFSSRFFSAGIMQDSSSYTATMNVEYLYYVLGFTNSKVLQLIKPLLNPTMHFVANDFKNTPFISMVSESINSLVNFNIRLSKQDWDTHETSWDFQFNELVSFDREKYMDIMSDYADFNNLVIDIAPPHLNSLESSYELYKIKWETNFRRLHANEEELNRQFIEIYGLQDELTPDVPLNEVTILQQGEIKIIDNEIEFQADVVIRQLISYAIGCWMGRYRLDQPGLYIAHPDVKEEEIVTYPYRDETLTIDDDGIIPILPYECPFEDNLQNRIADFVRIAFGNDSLAENLNFVEQALGCTIEKYLDKEYWKDHKKMYQNRPIYWLWSSKKGAFKVISYMHRMDAYTAERVRSKYLLPYIEYLNNKIADLESRAAQLSVAESRKLDALRKAHAECVEYHERLQVIAEQAIAFDLDDGVVVNYAKFGDVLAKIK